MWKYKPTHPASALRLCSLPLRPGWSFQPETAETVRKKLTTKKDTHTHRRLCSPGVLLAGAPSAVQRDYFLSADACLAHGTLLSAGPRLQPLMRRSRARRRMSKWLQYTSHKPIFICRFKSGTQVTLPAAFSKTLFTARDVKHNMFTVVSGEGSGSKRH